MKNATINLRDLVILIADPSAYLCHLTHSMLRGFGASKMLAVRSSTAVLQILKEQKIDILLCDSGLAPHSGLKLTQAIRRNVNNPNRTVPILIMTGDTRENSIKEARDAGANMVLTKPMSPASLYDRLSWIAFNPRNFVDAASYFGPDRRFKIEGYPTGAGRRKSDNVVEVGDESGSALAQDDINLFNAAKVG
jgi:two-component system, chemotaxis family, chemotaxis protein CheY